MRRVTTIGLDIAKSVFQVHAVDAAGEVIIRRQLKRRYVRASSRPPSPAPLEGALGFGQWEAAVDQAPHPVLLHQVGDPGEVLSLRPHKH
jgi:transposase